MVVRGFEGNIQVTIKELSAPVDARVRKSREDLLDLLEDITYYDIGKMNDQFGNPVEPHLLERGERMAIAGFEFTEDFIGVRAGRQKKDGGDSDDTKQMAAGYTKKYKHVDRHKYLTTYAKMLGYITDEPPETDDELKSLTISFVNSKGERVDPKTMEHTRPTRVIENQLDGPPFKLVR